MKKPEPDLHRDGELISIPFEINPKGIQTRVLEIIRKVKSQNDIEEAEMHALSQAK